MVAALELESNLVLAVADMVRGLPSEVCHMVDSGSVLEGRMRRIAGTAMEQ